MSFDVLGFGGSFLVVVFWKQGSKFDYFVFYLQNLDQKMVSENYNKMAP